MVCDNATNNDIMVERLNELVSTFKGQNSRVRCFAHVLNLVARSIITQFDVKTKAKNRSQDNDDLEYESLEEIALQNLAGDIDIEEEESQERLEEGGDSDLNNDEEGWVDEREKMSELELENLKRDVLPARRMLVKVSRARLPHLVNTLTPLTLLAPEGVTRPQQPDNHSRSSMDQDLHIR